MGNIIVGLLFALILVWAVRSFRKTLKGGGCCAGCSCSNGDKERCGKS